MNRLIATLLALLPVACGGAESPEAEEPESLGIISRPAEAANLSPALTDTPPELDSEEVDSHLTLGLSEVRTEASIEGPRDDRRYAFTVDHRRQVRIYVDGEGLDPTVEVVDESGRRVAFDNNSGEGTDASVQMQLDEGRYIIVVRGNRRSTGRFYLSLH